MAGNNHRGSGGVVGGVLAGSEKEELITRSSEQYLDRYRSRIALGIGFLEPDGKRWDPDNFAHDLRTANVAAHSPLEGLCYRHTFGSQLAMKGESLYKISTLMGNSPEICRRHYAALIPESLATSVDFESSDTHLLDARRIYLNLAKAATNAI